MIALVVGLALAAAPAPVEIAPTTPAADASVPASVPTSPKASRPPSPPPSPPSSPPPGASPAASQLPVEVSAAFGEGVSVTAPDESFGFKLRARLEPLGVWTVAPAAPAEERVLLSALVRRARLAVEAYALHEAITFKMELGLSGRDLEADLPVPLLDAFATWHVSPAFNLRVGQMKVPFNRQRVVSSAALQMVDRSDVNGELNLDRDVGLEIFATDLYDLGGIISYQLGVFGGEGRNRAIPDPGVLGVVRLQVAPFGRFDDMTEGDLERAAKLRFALAAGAAYNARSRRARSTFGPFFEDEEATVDYAHGEVDAILKWRGLSLMGEVIARNAVVNEDDAPVRSALGAFAQGGLMLTDHLEIVARGGRLAPLDEDVSAGPSEVEAGTEVAAGANAYFIDHDLKLQTDVTWEPDLELPSLTWRTQLQVYF